MADSTGKPDKRQRDNKETPKNVPSLKPHKHKKVIDCLPLLCLWGYPQKTLKLKK